MKLSIIVPVYNEERYIDTVIGKIKSTVLPDNITKEIIVINDGSVDDTIKILGKYSFDPEIKIFHRTDNRGKAQSIKLGIENSTGNIILIQDADLEYNPDDYLKLIRPIIKHQSLVVYGSRFKGNIKRMALINRIANIVSNMTFNLLFRTNISDINTCYKVFKKDALKNIKLSSKNFMFETEITAKLSRIGHKIYEVSVNYVARTKEEGKKMNWPQALKMYWGIIKYRFNVC